LPKVNFQQHTGLTRLSGKMGKQIGSDEKPITFRSPIYKNTHGSKGANPRPGFYTQDYRDNWDKIFGKKKTEENNNDND